MKALKKINISHLSDSVVTLTGIMVFKALKAGLLVIFQFITI